MLKQPKTRRRWFTLIAIAFALCITCASSRAETPSPAGTAPVVVAPVQQIPGTPGGPAAVQELPPAAKKEETAVVDPALPAAANGQAAVRPSVFQRAATFLQGREALAGDMAQRDKTILTLQQQLGARDATIQQLTAELTELRAGKTQLEQAMTKLETEQKTVVDTVAGLGFDQTKLPSGATLDQVAEGTIEGLQTKLGEEKDPVKRGEIMQRMIAIRDAKK